MAVESKSFVQYDQGIPRPDSKHADNVVMDDTVMENILYLIKIIVLVYYV